MTRPRMLRAALLFFLSAGLACSGPPARQAPRTAAEVPVLPFDSLFLPVGNVLLQADSANPIGYAVSMALSDSRVFIADPTQSDVKVFDRKTGALVKNLGRAGDGPGEFRTPATLTFTADQKLVAFDIGRSIISLWDSGGTMQQEKLNTGFFISFQPIPGTTRVITGGYYLAKGQLEFDSAGRRPLVHEIDYLTGEVASSYVRQPMPGGHSWASVYGTPRATLVGDISIAGTMGTNTMWMHNRATGAESEKAVLSPWYHLPDYPEQFNKPGQVMTKEESQYMRTWERKQYLLAGLITLGEGRFLAQYVIRDDDDGRFYNYIVADTAGVSWLSTEKTPVRIMAVKDGMAYGTLPDSDNGETRLLSFRLRPDVLGK